MRTLALPYEGVTQETLSQLAKSTSGILGSTGIEGIDLSGLVALIPVNVPARNNTAAFPREIAGIGSENATWEALLNINNEQGDIATGYDFAASLTKFDKVKVTAPYKPMGKFTRVTLDSAAQARNYADAVAVGQLQTLNQVFIGQDIHLINSQNWALGHTATPTLEAKHNAAASIKKEVVVKVVCVPRSGANYFVGGQGEKSAEAEVKTGAEEHNEVIATVPALKGAVAYDWYVKAGAGEFWYYTTTTIGKVVITTEPEAAATPPELPLFVKETPSAHVPAGDHSNSTKWYNGLIASNLADYGESGPVKPGEGTSSGCQFVDGEGKTITAEGSSVPLLDSVLSKVWNSVQLSPTAIMGNSEQIERISKELLESSTATTFLPPTEAEARTNLAGGGFVGRYINKAAGGVAVTLEVHPHVAPGTLIFRTDRVPYPGSNIGSVYSVRCQYDTMEFQYAAARGTGEGEGPRYDSEIRSMETLVNRAPNAQAILANVV